MSRYQVIPRTMCFVFYDDEVLLMKAGDKKDYPGVLNPVGGHVEKGENVIASAIREIKEESGLEVINARLRGIVHVNNFFGKDILMFVLTSHAETRKVIPNEEGELLWVKISDLKNCNIFADVKPLLEAATNRVNEDIFSATSQFDGAGKLITLQFNPKLY